MLHDQGSIKQGETKDVSISIKRGTNFQDDVTLKFTDEPQGVTIVPASPVIKNGETDAKLMLKSDGSVMVHADTGGFKPQNWMTPPTVIEHEGEPPERIVVRKRAGKTEDRLDVRIVEILSDVEHDMGEAAALAKVPGTVERVSTEEGGGYEAHVRKADPHTGELAATSVTLSGEEVTSARYCSELKVPTPSRPTASR